MWFTGWTEGGGSIRIGYATSVPDTNNNTTGIKDNLLKQVPRECNLFQNYPNPFNPITTISYQLPVSEKPAGTYQVRFNASHYAS